MNKDSGNTNSSYGRTEVHRGLFAVNDSVDPDSILLPGPSANKNGQYNWPEKDARDVDQSFFAVKTPSDPEVAG